jgi:hypothetical protein
LAVFPLSIALIGCGSVATPSVATPSATEPAVVSPQPTPATVSSPDTSAAAPNASASAALDMPKIAAQHLLATKAFDLELKISREQRSTDPVVTLVTGSGRMEPVSGRGHVRYDFTGLFAGSGSSPAPGAPGGSSVAPTASAGSSPAPTAAKVVELVWTPSDEYLRIAGGSSATYEKSTRDQARQSGGLVGRLPDEVLGLARLVAESDPSQARPLDPAELAGFAVDRWTVSIPVEAAAAAGVPGYLPDAAAVRSQYGASTIDVEVWLIGGILRRLQYQLARDQAPYGGPDRTTTMYDWLNAADDVAIEVPG